MQKEFVPNWLLRRLRARPSLAVFSQGSGRVAIKVAGGPREQYQVMQSSRISEPDAIAIATRVLDRPSAQPRLLVATEALTPGARRTLRERGVSWIERATGVGSLVAPSFLIEIAGPEGADVREVNPSPHQRKCALVGKSGLITETLLEWGGDAPVALQDIGERAAVSKGLVSRVLSRLETLKVLTADGGGPHKRWRVRDREKLLDIWSAEENTTPELVVQVYAWTRGPLDQYRNLARLDQAGIPWALAGVPAANAYAPHLTVLPDPIVWADAATPSQAIAKALGGEVVKEGGNVVVLQGKDNGPLVHARSLDSAIGAAGLRSVSPWRAALESARVPGRGADVAEHLRQTLLHKETRA